MVAVRIGSPSSGLGQKRAMTYPEYIAVMQLGRNHGKLADAHVQSSCVPDRGDSATSWQQSVELPHGRGTHRQSAGCDKSERNMPEYIAVTDLGKKPGKLPERHDKALFCPRELNQPPLQEAGLPHGLTH